MGCIGMNLDDFRRCTPAEFSVIYRFWLQHDERNVQNDWEQTRFLACCMLQPYSKKKLSPTDVCRFSWERKREQEAKKEVSTKERFEEIAKKWGERRDVIYFSLSFEELFSSTEFVSFSQRCCNSLRFMRASSLYLAHFSSSLRRFSFAFSALI